MGVVQRYFWLLLSVMLMTSRASPSYWKDRLGHCRAPTTDDYIMSNPVELAATQSELSLSGQTLSISTASTAHLLVAPSGTFSNPSVGGKIMCEGKMVAWNSPNALRSLTWSAPANTMVTLVMAGGYGPVTLFTLTVPGETNSSTSIGRTTVGSQATIVTTTSLPSSSTVAEAKTETMTTTTPMGEISTTSRHPIDTGGTTTGSETTTPMTTSVPTSGTSVQATSVPVTKTTALAEISTTSDHPHSTGETGSETAMVTTRGLPSSGTVADTTTETVTKTTSIVQISTTGNHTTTEDDHGVLSGVKRASSALAISFVFLVSALSYYSA